MSAVAEKPISIGTDKPAQPERSAKERRGLSPKSEMIVAWQQQVYQDELPASAYRLAMAMTQNLWPHTDGFCCKKWQKWLADETHMVRQTVQNAVNALIAGGHLVRESGKSAGRANIYVLRLRPADAAAEPSPAPEPVEAAASDDPEDNVFAPAPAQVAEDEPSIAKIEAELVELAEVYADMIEHVRKDPDRAIEFQTTFAALEWFRLFQFAFPSDCRSSPDGEAEVAFLETIGHAFDPIALFRAARRDVQKAQDGGLPAPKVEVWIADFLQGARF